MAVVGEAHILVRAITTGLKKDIEKGFQGIKGATEAAGRESGDAFSKEFSKGLNKFNKESQAAAKNFHKLMRQANIFQAGIGIAASSLSALVAALGAFVGAVGGAAAAGVALVGVMAQLKVATLVGKQAFSGIMQAIKQSDSAGGAAGKTMRELREEMQQLAFSAEEAALSQEKASLSLEKARENLARVQNLPPDNRARREAELAYQEADLAYRKAADRHSDLMEQINDPQAKKTSGAQDPYKNLTETQKAFALYLKGIMPKMRTLREAAASSFLPELTKQMNAMMKNGFFQLVYKGFERVSQGLAEATRNFAGSAFDATTKGSLAHFFESSRGTVGTLGRVLGNVFKAFLAIMQAADPLIKRFVNFLDRKSFSLADSIVKNQGPLTGFFRNAGDAAATLGKIFGNVFKGLSSLITANIGPGSPGQGMLDWMAKGSEKWAQLSGSIAQNSMNSYFSQAVENFKAMWGAISGFGSILMSLASSPGVAEFWTTLQAGQDSLERIFMAMTSAGPGLAGLINQLVEIIALFSDTHQIQTYIAVLTTMFRFLLEIGKMFAPIANALGPLIGTIGALVTTYLILKKVIMIVYGTIFTFGKGLMFLRKAFLLVKGAQVAATTATVANTTATAANTVVTNVSKGAKMKEAIMTLFGNKAKEKENVALLQATIARQAQLITSLELTAANGALAVSEGAVGTAASASVPGITAMGASLWAAMAPVLPVILAIAAAIAAVVAVVAIVAAVNAANVKEAEDAQKRVGEQLKSNYMMGKSLASQTAKAQMVWTEAISSTGSSAQNAIGNIKNLKGVSAELVREQKKLGYTYTTSTYNLDEFKEGLNNLGKELGKMAKKDLKGAQQQFIRFANAQGASRQELQAQLAEMPEFQAQLEKQAKKMGIVTDGMSEEAKQSALLDTALNTGTYAAAKAAEAQANFAAKVREAAASFYDFEGPLQQNSEDVKAWAVQQAKSSKSATDTWKDYWDGQSFSLEKYMDDLNAQVDKQLKWSSNLGKLQGAVKEGLITQDTLDRLKTMGVAGADLVDSLSKKYEAGTAGAKKTLKNFQSSFALSAPDVAPALADAFTNPQNDTVLKMATTKIGKAMGGSVAGQFYNQMKADLDAGKITLAEIMKKYGITMEDVANEVKRLKIEADVTVTWNGGTNLTPPVVNPAQLPPTSYNSSYLTTGRTGGMFRNLMRYKTGKGAGTFQMFPNGLLRGPGGPRTDSILARVSKDEYVVNAQATARNKEVLDYINRGGVVTGGGSMYNMSFVVNAAPGMDETQVARIVLRTLDRQLGLGGAK